MKKPVKRRHIALHYFGKVCGGACAEVNAKHAPDGLRRGHDVMFARCRGEPLSERTCVGGEPVEKSRRFNWLESRQSRRNRDRITR